MAAESQDVCSDTLSIISSNNPVIIGQECLFKLDNYAPQDSNDDTVTILRAFLDNLLEDGLVHIMDDIKSRENDSDLQ